MKGVFFMYYNYYNYQDGDRQFILPFLLGGLVGGAAVGISRPRPVVATNYPTYGRYPYYGYGSPYNYYPYYRY